MTSADRDSYNAPMSNEWVSEIAASAARIVVEEGLEYGPAKRRALRQLGRHNARGFEMPSNEQVEDEVRSYLALFCGDTQPDELAKLRRLALGWMERLAEFRPHLAGAVWRGTATRLSPLRLDLYCDDAKAAEIALINLGVDYDADAGPNGRDDSQSLVFRTRCDELGSPVVVQLVVLDHDDLRGALKADAQGRSWRGDAAAVRRLLGLPVEAGRSARH
jgi:hypothetical protein